MKIPSGATIAVADGEKLSLFHNAGDETNPKLTEKSIGDISKSNKSGGTGHSSSSANPDESQAEEDSFAAGIAEVLNKQAIEGKMKSLIVIAAPKTLGELRKHYHQKLKDVLAGEIAKDLTGQKSDDIEKAIASA